MYRRGYAEYVCQAYSWNWFASTVSELNDDEDAEHQKKRGAYFEKLFFKRKERKQLSRKSQDQKARLDVPLYPGNPEPAWTQELLGETPFTEGTVAPDTYYNRCVVFGLNCLLGGPYFTTSWNYLDHSGNHEHKIQRDSAI